MTRRTRFFRRRSLTDSSRGNIPTLLIGLETMLSVAAAGGAVAMLAGTTPLGEATDDLPFRSPVLAGVALAAINGIVPLTAVVGTLRRAWWAPFAHLAVSAALVGWIALQVAVIGLTSWLQPILLAYGILVGLLAVDLDW
ncbi:MAG: hypothetical protein ABJH68_16525 [Ilumatobacter sp.]|uniref:hypothetical protein n=1 Tax=Ilumatobacter sp. TaxID=1967498 RepID=UPI00329766B1